MNKRFDHTKIFIKRSQSFPSFHIICNDLELEEIELDHLAAQGEASAFYSAPLGGGHPPHQQLPPRPPQQEPLCPPVAPPPSAPTPTTAAQVRVRARGRGREKVRTMAPVAPVKIAVTTAGVPRRGPPFTIPGPAPSRCGQGCVLHSSSWHVHHNTPCSLHQHTTGLPAIPPSHPCRLHRTSSKL
jgi:hypothetical protein